MLYMPAVPPNQPVVLQETQQVPLQGTSRYFMMQSAPVVPAVPVLNTTYVYPRYGFVPKPVETSVTKEDIEKSQPIQLYEVAQPVQHVMHHHVQANASSSCAGYCELCCPWTVHGHVQVSHPCTCSTSKHTHKRCSRRDQFEQDELDQVNSSTGETIDEKIARIRFELGVNISHRACASSQTQPVIEHHIHHRPRSNSRPRSASAGREAWRSTGQNDYPWRDSHLPGYREATFARAQTPVDESRVWKETAHERSHQNTQKSSAYYKKTGYVYHPKSESEAKKHYTQMTGKNADQEVHQALRGGTTTYKYNGSSNGHYDRHQSARYDHGAHSSVPTTTKTHSLRKIDSTQHHNLYACNEPCLHVIPKSGSAADPPYVKILNAPVTYLH